MPNELTAEQFFLRRISEASDPSVKRCVQAELAGYLARLGDYAPAEELVKKLRAELDWSSARLSALLNVAEALIELRNEYSQVAQDKLRRAFAIASSFQEHDVAGLASTWLAHTSFNCLNEAELARWVATCIELRPHLSWFAKSRLYLTHASIAAYAGDQAVADKWFAAARFVSVSNRDESSIAAAMHNRSLLGIARARLDVACGERSPRAIDSLDLEIQSAMAYARATGNRSANVLQSLWHGRVEMLLGGFAAALPKIQRALLELPEAIEPNIRIGIESDLAYCFMKVGDLQTARSLNKVLPASSCGGMQVDDRIVFLWQQAEILSAISCQDDAAKALDLLLLAKAELSSLCASLHSMLPPISFVDSAA